MLLVAGEVCLATILLVGSGLLIRSFVRVSGIDAGFRPDHVLKMTMALPSVRYHAASDRGRFFDRVLGEVRTIPGVQVAAFTTKLPLLGGSNGTIVIEGRPAPKHLWDAPLVEFSYVSPDYFRGMGITVVVGKAFPQRIFIRPRSDVLKVRKPSSLAVTCSMLSTSNTGCWASTARIRSFHRVGET